MKALYLILSTIFSITAFAQQSGKAELPAKQETQNAEAEAAPTPEPAYEVVVAATPAPTPAAPAPAELAAPAPSVVVVKVNEKAKEESSQKNAFFGLLFSSASEVKFGKVSSTGVSTEETKADLNSAGAGGFTLGVQNFRDDTFGYSFGVSHEAMRKISSSSLKTGTNTTTTVYAEDQKATFSLTTIDLNAVIKSRSIYFPMGVNYSLIHFRNAASSTADLSMAGGLGAQIGLGVMVSPKFSFELLAKAISLSMKEKDTAGNTVTEYSQGYMGGVNVIGKLFF